MLDSHDDGSATALLLPTVSAKAIELNVVVDPATGGTLLHLTALHRMGATTAALVKAGADVSVKVLCFSRNRIQRKRPVLGTSQGTERQVAVSLTQQTRFEIFCATALVDLSASAEWMSPLWDGFGITEKRYKREPPGTSPLRIVESGAFPFIWRLA